MNRCIERIFISSKKLFCDVTYVNKWQFNVALFSTKKDTENSEIPKNVVQEFYTAHLQSDMGVIYDKKPFKLRLLPNKAYFWCTCGHSRTQPFCDGMHKKPTLKIKLRPVKFEVSEEKDYWLCNCKQTANRPFCDGTHKRQDIQDKKL